jgi:ATP-dependent Clp protease adaptor protein ClpS
MKVRPVAVTITNDLRKSAKGFQMTDWEDDDDDLPDHEENVATETKKKVEKPKLFKVLLHNDDYTTMEFVVLVLREVFNKAEQDALRIMMAVHLQGIGVAGVYTFEIAEAKVNKVIDMARNQQFPLLCTMEEE